MKAAVMMKAAALMKAVVSGEGRGDGGRVDGGSDGGDAAELEQRRPRRREAAGTKVRTRPTSLQSFGGVCDSCSPKNLAAISDPPL